MFLARASDSCANPWIVLVMTGMKRDKRSHTERRSARSARPMLHGIVIASCVGISALVTWLEPISVIELDRAGSTINGRIAELWMFVLPVRNAAIDGVKTFREELKHTSSLARKDGRFGIRLTESHQTDAILVMTNETEEARVRVSYANSGSVLQRLQKFQASDSPTHLRIVAVSNWKATICSGLLMAAAILYLPWRTWRRRIRLTNDVTAP